MSELVFSPEAQADLVDVWEYTQERWDEDQADRYIRQIVAACQDLAEGMRISRAADDIRLGYRKYPVESHVIYFKEANGVLDVVRVLHQQMDMPRHFRE